MMNREELAWSAGFFDGEGHCGTITRTDGGLIVPHLDITQIHPETLERFRSSVGGIGSIQGPYYPAKFKDRGWKPRYQYHAASFQHVQAIVAMLWAWLTPIKRAQAAVALQAAVGSSRSRPGKLHMRTICKRGHSLIDPTNIRPQQNSVTGYTERRCVACMRLRARGYEARKRLVRRTALAMLTA